MSIQGILNNRGSQINSSNEQESTMWKRMFTRKWEKHNKNITLGENEHDCVRLSLWRNNYTIHIATIWCSQHDILMTLINPHPSGVMTHVWCDGHRPTFPSQINSHYLMGGCWFFMVSPRTHQQELQAVKADTSNKPSLRNWPRCRRTPANQRTGETVLSKVHTDRVT